MTFPSYATRRARVMRYDDEMRWPLVLGLVAVTGCDRLFEFNADPVAATCAEPLAPDGDEDHDSVLNGVDACPRVANQEAHDEDQDSTLDACDLCPQLVTAGADVDCDGLGAACDPDDTIPHIQEFFGFGSSRGIRLAEATVANDVLQLPIPSTAQIAGSGHVDAPVDGDGTYEITGRFRRTTHPPATDFGYVALRFTPLQGTVDYLARISGGDSGGPYGYFQIQENGVSVAETSIGTLPLDGAFTLRVTITATTMDATLTGFATATLTVPLTAPMGTVEYWIEAYHDVGSDFVADIASLRRVALAP